MYAQQFTAGASYTNCAADVWLAKVASPTGNLSVGIWSNNATGPVPNTLISESGTVAASTLTTFTTSAAIPVVNFTGLSAALTSGTVYWVAVHQTVLGTGTNFIRWATASTTNVNWATSANWSTWTTFGGNPQQPLMFRLYST